MNEFISHPYYKFFIHKIKESEAYLVIISCLLPNFVITHIKGHQDDTKPYQDLTIAEQLNVDADTIAISCATKPINIHLLSTPFVIFVKREYIHLPPHKRIREVSFKENTKQFLQAKYGWNSLTINNID